MEDKRRLELEEEMSRFEQEIAGQLPPPPKPPTLQFFSPSSSSESLSGRQTSRSSTDTGPRSHVPPTSRVGESAHGSHQIPTQGPFQIPPPHMQHPQQNAFPPPLHPPPIPPSVLPSRPQMPLPPPIPMGIGRPSGPLVPPPVGPVMVQRLPQQSLIPPPMPPMIPILTPAPVSNVTVTTAAPVIKPPTVPLDNYEPLPNSGDGEDGGDGSSNTDGKDDGKRKDKKRKYVRVGGGTSWEDDTLSDWDPNDFRIFVGDLGNEVTDEHLYRAFAKYTSVLKARIVRDKKTKKTKGYGFVSFKDPQDYLKAMREMNGKYVGNRPIKLRKSTWKDRNIEVVKKKDKEKKKLGLR